MVSLGLPAAGQCDTLRPSLWQRILETIPKSAQSEESNAPALEIKPVPQEPKQSNIEK
jgi:hypothetical protein